MFGIASLLIAVGMGMVSDFLGLSSTTGAFSVDVLLVESGYRAEIEVSFFELLCVSNVLRGLCARWTEAMQPLFLTMSDLNSP